MQAIAQSAVWVCVLIVALPLSPCAFFSSACCGELDAAKLQQSAAADRPCCAHHSESTGNAPEEPAQDDSRSCDRGCCQLSPFVPAAQPVLDHPPLAAWVAILPEANVDSAIVTALEVPPTVAETIPLQILHCQWRC